MATVSQDCDRDFGVRVWCDAATDDADRECHPCARHSGNELYCDETGSDGGNCDGCTWCNPPCTCDGNYDKYD